MVAVLRACFAGDAQVQAQTPVKKVATPVRASSRVTGARVLGAAALLLTWRERATSALGVFCRVLQGWIRWVCGHVDAQMSCRGCRSRASGTGMLAGWYGPAAGAMGTDRNALAGHNSDLGCG